MRRQTWTAVALLLLIAMLALGCGANQLIARAPTPTATPTKTPKPTFTPTVEPTTTPVPPDTPEPTATAVPPTDTPEPTATAAPTDTPVPPTATPQPPATQAPQPRVQPTAPPPPPPTATPAPPPPSDPFKGTLVKWEPNCAGNQVKGHIKTSTGSPINSGVVKINLYGNIINSPVGPQWSSLGDGGWDWGRWGEGHLSDPVTLAFYSNDGERISNEIVVAFDTGPCEPGGSGHQVATVEFICVRPDICG